MDNISISTPFGTIGINYIHEKNNPVINPDNYRLYFVISGTARICSSKTCEKFFAVKNDLICVSPGTDFVVSHKKDFAVVCMSFDEKYYRCQLGELSAGQSINDLFSESANGIKSFRRSLANHDKVYYLARDIFEEAETQRTGYRMIINARFAEVLIMLSRSPCLEAELCSKPASQAVFDAAEFMENNFTLDLTVEKLANFVSLSPRHFTRMFSQTYGMPPMKYLEELRLRRAAMMLVNTDKTVTEISFDCGYNDSNYFSKQFKRYFSGTPVQYRKDMRESRKSIGFGE